MIAHSEEYARSIGAVSAMSLRREQGKPRRPIFFDNGLVMRLCDQAMANFSSEESLIQEIQRLESEVDSLRQQEGLSVKNAFKLFRCIQFPELATKATHELRLIASQERMRAAGYKRYY